MNPETPGEIERLARAISETRRRLEESERILQEASGAFVRRASALAAQEPQLTVSASETVLRETGA